MPAREISIANRHPRLRLDRRAVSRAIRVLDAHHAAILAGGSERTRPDSAVFLHGELSLVFLTDSALAKLHADFLDDPTTTDVITFEGDPLHGTAGEICVSVDAALRHVATVAPRRSPATLAFATELTLYVVHGWLHLAGCDDLSPAKKRAMRRAEARAMRVLREAGAVPRLVIAPVPNAPGKSRGSRADLEWHLSRQFHQHNTPLL